MLSQLATHRPFFIWSISICLRAFSGLPMIEQQTDELVEHIQWHNQHIGDLG